MQLIVSEQDVWQKFISPIAVPSSVISSELIPLELLVMEGSSSDPTK